MSEKQTPLLITQALVLSLILVILSLMVAPITSLIEERRYRQEDAKREISATWGGSQRLAGPVLSVPGVSATFPKPDLDFIILPAALDIRAEVTPQERRRGLFKALVYTTTVHLSGYFDPSDLAEGLANEAAEIDWSQAELLFGPSDLRGLLANPELIWNGEELEIEPLSEAGTLPLGTLRAHGPALAASLSPPDLDIPNPLERGPLEFKAKIVVRGSGDLDFLPLGRETQVHMVSEWPHPSFHGAYLPSTPADVEGGLRGEWSIPHFARGYPQRFELRLEELGTLSHAVESSAFGVRLMQPIDFYQLTIRCTKYALLFAVMILGAFLVHELISHLKLHPVQYLMVAAALTLFYLLLLALAEHIGFHQAFLLAAAATTLLIGAYGATLLGDRMKAAGLAVTLATMYGVLFVIVQLQSYALLMGSLVLFGLLALTMWLTRNVDWHEAFPVWRERQAENAHFEL